MATIKQILAREIINGNGAPTVEARVILSDGTTARASCPTGISIGSYEAKTLVDADPTKHSGQGVQAALQAITTDIAPKLIGMDATKQSDIDKAMLELDGTPTKSKLGANTLLPISVAIAKAAAKSSSLPLFLYLREFMTTKPPVVKTPTPIFTILSSGLLANEKPNFQNFLLMPATSMFYTQGLDLGIKVYEAVREALRTPKSLPFIAVDGGIIPPLSTNIECLSTMAQTIQRTTLRLGFDLFLGIDMAANTFYRTKQYKIVDKEADILVKELNDYYQDIVKQFHLLYVEDPLAEDDFDGWQDLSTRISQQAIIAGDDITPTNLYRLQTAISRKLLTAVIIKPSQVGTVIESLAIAEVAKTAGLKIIASSRSIETNDDFIADFAVAVGADYIRCGGLSRGEHIAKYNRLSQIDMLVRAHK